jgi:hypothetical protein
MNPAPCLLIPVRYLYTRYRCCWGTRIYVAQEFRLSFKLMRGGKGQGGGGGGGLTPPENKQPEISGLDQEKRSG